ncbi:MAG: hypothetical protein R3B96_11175 [Pirellulaceae bacterium]
MALLTKHGCHRLHGVSPFKSQSKPPKTPRSVEQKKKTEGEGQLLLAGSIAIRAQATRVFEARELNN